MTGTECKPWWTTHGGYVARLACMVLVIVVMANVVGFGVTGHNDAMSRIRGNNVTHTLQQDGIVTSINVLKAQAAAGMAARTKMRGVTTRLADDIVQLTARLYTQLNATLRGFGGAASNYVQLNTTVRQGLINVQQHMQHGYVQTTRVNATLHAHIGADADGEVRMFHTDRGCPVGWRELSQQGFALVSRPVHGQAGTTFNRALTAHEQGRVGAHGHSVVVTDPGHVHATGIYAEGNNKNAPQAQDNANVREHHTARSTTGVGVRVLNSTGEDLPLLHVLLCTQDTR